MSDLPDSVEIFEEGPREGFQSEPVIATEAKIRLIDALAQTGLREINTCSFVNPKRVPQMADAEAIAAGIHRRSGVRYAGLWLNVAGFERARETKLDLYATIGVSASETFGLRNNGRDRAGLLEEQRKLALAYRHAAVPLSAAYIFTSFGCNYEGAVPTNCVIAAARDLLAIAAAAAADCAPPVLYLCDTIGTAGPDDIERMVGAVRSAFPAVRIGLHLHDTRGLGIVNALTGLRMGVDRFDASVGGLGGCPFAGSSAAAGNICTEDFAWLCEGLGVSTGINLDALAECGRLAEEIVGHPLPGRFHTVGRPTITV